VRRTDEAAPQERPIARLRDAAEEFHDAYREAREVLGDKVAFRTALRLVHGGRTPSPLLRQH
jgi:hypothetical protein